MRTGGARNGEGAWDVVIRPRRSLFDMDLKGVWQYRDLVRLLVRRDVIAVYKQTVLGPLWHIIQPLTTTITFTVIFGMVARLSPEGVPAVLFYMSGIVAWNYFSTVVTKTSKTFIGNTNLMSKVYFPRLVVPLSTALSSLFSFGIQFATMLAFFLWYHLFNDGFTWRPAPTILLLPLLVVVMALLGLGAGIIVSALTTKYRDLSFLVGYSNDVFNSGESGTYVAASGSFPLPVWDLTLDGSVGNYDLDKALGDSYQDVSVGLSRSFGEMSAGITYAYATNDIDRGENGGSRVFLSVGWAF